MKTAIRRLSGTAVLSRPSLLPPATLALGVLLAGCVTDSGTGITSPPSDSNNSVFSWENVVVGGLLNCLLTSGGSALCWGEGALGDGRTTDFRPPGQGQRSDRVRGAQHRG